MHVMLDIETLGKGPYAPVVAIGAVQFNPNNPDGPQSPFYRKMTFAAASRERIPDQSTLDWWARQSEGARAELMSNQEEDVHRVLEDFCAWFPRHAQVWGNGPTFDITIMETLLGQYGLPVPWQYYNVRDVRTIVGLTKGRVDKDSIPFVGTAHGALDDATHQAKYVSLMWAALRS